MVRSGTLACAEAGKIYFNKSETCCFNSSAHGSTAFSSSCNPQITVCHQKVLKNTGGGSFYILVSFNIVMGWSIKYTMFAGKFASIASTAWAYWNSRSLRVRAAMIPASIGCSGDVVLGGKNETVTFLNKGITSVVPWQLALWRSKYNVSS